MDCRDWDQDGVVDFRKIKGSISVPIGDQIHCKSYAFPFTVSPSVIFRTGKYLVLEAETGTHRIRVGNLTSRIVSTTDLTNNTISLTNHTYQTGDGPLRFKTTAWLRGNPVIAFFSIPGAGGDRIVRAVGSGPWLGDGFSAGNEITIEGTQFNNFSGANRLVISSFATTFSSNDTIVINETLGPGADPITNETVNSGCTIYRGALPVPLDWHEDYWIIRVPGSTSLVKLALSRGDALAGVAVDLTSLLAGSTTVNIGGDQGPYKRVGWGPVAPVAAMGNTVDGEGEKLLREGEMVVISASCVTVNPQSAASILKYWNVG